MFVDSDEEECEGEYEFEFIETDPQEWETFSDIQEEEDEIREDFYDIVDWNWMHGITGMSFFTDFSDDGKALRYANFEDRLVYGMGITERALDM